MQRLREEEAVLMIVDVQERLLPVIHEGDSVASSCATLAQAATIFHIPIIVTEQYPAKLGTTVPIVQDACENFTAFSKQQFSSCTDEVMEIFSQNPQRRSVILCGVEAHVCVLQTALDLRARNYDVFIVRDAIGSRKLIDQRTGWQRIIQAGAIPVSVESTLFELLKTSERPEFKSIHRLIK